MLVHVVVTAICICGKILAGKKLANLVNLSADTPKMYLAYAPTVAYSLANSFYLYGLPKIPPKFSRVQYSPCVCLCVCMCVSGLKLCQRYRCQMTC